MIPTISTVTSLGLNKFRSIFSSASLKDFAQGSGISPRAYAATTRRGILINKENVHMINSATFVDMYTFQFNPQTITDAKETLYETRNYAGLAYSDYIWGGGGERVINFQLFLDNTPQSKIASFNPRIGAAKVKVDGITVTKGGALVDNTKYGINDALGTLGLTTFMTAPNLKPFEFDKGDAYSITRVNERGILPEVEQIRAFLYPAPIANKALPRFADGGIVAPYPFRPPAIAVLSLGPLYLEGVIKAAPVTYTLFDSDLTPLRATIDITFAVHEFVELQNNRTT